jgi:hypothetical protein
VKVLQKVGYEVSSGQNVGDEEVIVRQVQGRAAAYDQITNPSEVPA